MSYREVAEELPQLLFVDPSESVKVSTCEDLMVSTGNSTYEGMLRHACKTLKDNGYDPSNGAPLPETAAKSVPREWGVEGVEEIIAESEEYNSGKKDVRCHIKDLGKMAEVESRVPGSCVKITIDGVVILKQKEHRGKEPAKVRTRKHVEIVNVHIRYGDKVHEIPAKNLDDAMVLLTATLLETGLMDKRLIFITDGQRTISDAVERNFAHIGYDLYIDWYHLSDKIYTTAKSDLVGTKEEKDAFAKKVSDMLWAGNTKDALEFILGMPDEKYKNLCMGNLTTYIQNKAEHIPCYALRNRLGLHTSSNEVEMTNNMLVSNREKDKGMSWSHCGGLALAVIKSMFYNETIDDFVLTRTAPKIKFSSHVYNISISA